MRHGNARRISMLAFVMTAGLVSFGCSERRPTVESVLVRAIEAEEASWTAELDQISLSCRGELSNERQRYRLVREESASLPSETALEHFFLDRSGQRFQTYSREVYHGGHDLRFETLALGWSYKLFRIAHQQAAEQAKAGCRKASFPPGSFPGPGRFVPLTS